MEVILLERIAKLGQNLSSELNDGKVDQHVQQVCGGVVMIFEPSFAKRLESL